MNKSKVLKLIIILVLTIFAVSGCSDDDNPTSAGSDRLIGVWKATTSTTSFGSISSPDSTKGFPFTDGVIEFTLTIKFDHTWTAVFVVFAITNNSSGTWLSTGTTLTVKEAGESDDTFEYSISGNNLTLESSETIDGYTTFEVVEYTRE